jgi:protein tyrosine phosphatase
MKSDQGISWVIPNRLARSCRPGYWDDDILLLNIHRWITEAQGMSIKSILCLLTAKELRKYYYQHEIDLLDYYHTMGFLVRHIPVLDHQMVPIPRRQIGQLIKTAKTMPEPILVHCSAGVDRTGMAVEELCKRVFCPQNQPKPKQG